MSSPLQPVSLDVMLFWRTDCIAVRRLAGSGSVVVGAAPDALAPIPCVPASCESFELARVVAEAGFARVPAGVFGRLQRGDYVDVIAGPAETRLARGESLHITLGEFHL